MQRTIDAIYENGILKPLEELNIEDKQRVKITITPISKTLSKIPKNIPRPIREMIKILHGPLPINPIEKIAKDSELDID